MGFDLAILTFLLYIFNFFCTTTTPLVARRPASGKTKGTILISNQALTLSLYSGIILTTVIILFQQPLLQLMLGTNLMSSTSADASSFFVVRALEVRALFCISVLTCILRGYLDTTTPFYILIGANIFTLALDCVLIVKPFQFGPTGTAIITMTTK